jgi:hypothetical protein
VICEPTSFAMISTLPFWKMPTHENVMPRSIPITVFFFSSDGGSSAMA